MNERLFINEIEVELNPNERIARTLQVNDLARLDTRQTNLTKNIKVPRTPKNTLLLDYLGVMGNNSNFPYQRNKAKYFVGNECLIFNGWVTCVDTNATEYELVIYDGNIDFYKAIENTKLSDVGISDLNHLKNISAVTSTYSSNSTLPYKYIVADYNGNNTYDDVKINIDYQLPSANVKFIWDKIFDYVNFTYSGNIFSNVEFTNLWMTFPKPVPSKEPVTTDQTEQGSVMMSDVTTTPTENGGIFYGTVTYFKLFPNSFTATHTSGNGIYITFTQSGVFQLKVSGSATINGNANNQINWAVRNVSPNVIVQSGSFDASNPQENKIIFTGTTGQRLFISSAAVGGSGENYYNDLQGSFTSDLNLVLGYDANFEEVLVDFSTKDFVNEIMQRFGLTMQKDKYSNHLSFYTLDEVLKSAEVDNWTDKLIVKLNEKYQIGDYAQINHFKYRYNEENAKHNNGYFTVNDVNLKDEITVIQSKIYSPDDSKEIFFGQSNQLYKFWNREVEKDGSIKYKELTGRYYFMRYDQTATTVKVGSQALFTQQTVSSIPTANFNNLKFQQIIDTYYPSVKSIIDKSKVISCDFNLNESDISNFDFKKLIYLKQFGSYYLVNKISNYISGKSTKVELLEVDYQKSFSDDIIIPTGSTVTGTLTIDTVVVDGCLITMTYSTTLPTGTQINLVAEPNDFDLGLPVFFVDPLYQHFESYFTTGATGTIQFSLEDGNYYQAYLSSMFGEVRSNEVTFENTGVCTISSPSGLTITNVTLQSSNTFSNEYKIDFSTDAVLPRTVYYSAYYPSGFGAGWSTYIGVTTSSPTLTVNLSTLFSSPTKVKLKIGLTESNEFNI